MIPSDLAVRLRLLAESQISPVTPVHEIPSEPPELPVGQRFVARIESPLPDGTFRALVAGRSLTLALQQPARPGDTLDLVVTGRSAGLVVAERADEAAARPPSAQPTTTLSHAARIIGAVLAGEDHAPQPATIARAAPLLSMPPAQAAELVPALRQTIVESGLFYESHQALWVAGRYPAEALAREPQSRHAPARVALHPSAAAKPEAAGETPPLPAENIEPAAARGAAAAPPALPAELQTLVQQQLDVAATQHIVWRGEIWPGQLLDWEIETEERPPDLAGEEAAETWSTTLRLSLPGLGHVDAVLRLTPEKVSLAMTAAEGAETLRSGLPALADAFVAAGLPPLAASVGSHEPA